MSSNVVEEISKEVIKPSSPTPGHLQTFHLSLFDQVSPPIHTPVILFYGPSHPSDHEHLSSVADGNKTVSDRLKKSLSETLTRFYPVAGRYKLGNNNMLVDCNDEGIDYIEARAEGSISSFMKRHAVHCLLPANIDLSKFLMDNDPLVIVKVTFFDCGGIAICVCITNKIADASTFTTFINSWTSIARGGATNENNKSAYHPTFESAILYPPREESTPAFASADESSTTADHDVDNSTYKVSTRRLVFDAPKIAALQAKYRDPSDEKKYTTRVMAVSTLLWKTAIAASSSKKPCVALHAVNLRKRMNPPLHPQAFGHIVTFAATSPVIKDGITSDAELVCTLKEAISKIDDEYVKAMQTDEGVLRIQEIISMAFGANGNVDMYTFTSWCKFPLYDADFGWGKPIWVTSCGGEPFKNMFILTDSNSTGDGIEVYVGLVEEEMAIFERDQELLESVSFLD